MYSPWPPVGSKTCLCGFLAGVSMTLMLDEIWPISWLLSMLTLAALALVINVKFRPLFFVVMGFVYLGLQAQWALDYSFPSEYERVDIELEGRVIGLPIKTNSNGFKPQGQSADQLNDYRFRFLIEKTADPKLTAIEGQRVQLSCYRCPLNFKPNQHWRLTVRMKRPRGYASWGAFDYERYLFRHALIAKGYVRLKSDNDLIHDDVQGVSVWREKIRAKISSNVSDNVGQKIILALTIGDKSGLSSTQKKVFQDTGISHLMAISGLHIGLVFMAVTRMLRVFLTPFAQLYHVIPRPFIIMPLAFLAALFYAALAGFAVSTQRALIMLLVYVICRFLAREMSLLSVLLVAAFVIVLVDPLSLLDFGFWLSCGAVFIIAVSQQENKTLSIPLLQGALWLGMIPMTLVFFGKASLVSPFVNLILVPLFCVVLIPITLLLSVLGLTGSDIFFSMFLVYVANIYSYIYEALSWLSHRPNTVIFTTPLLWWQWCLVGIALVSTLASRLKFAFFVSLFVLISVLIKPVEKLHHDEIHIVLLDVGQGLSMVIETPNSITVYDTGARYSSGFSAANAVLLPYLRRRGVETINELIISHADNDHFGGYDDVMSAFKVNKVITSRLDNLPNASLCEKGQAWQYDHTEFEILSPSANTPNGSNNHSCVLKVTHKGHSVLLTADIEKQVERYMLGADFTQLKSDILLVPHQGSKTSSTHAFLDAVQPQVALLAAGYKNHYEHPHADVVKRYSDRGIPIFSTIDSGSILLKINSQGWHITEYRHSERRFWAD